MQALYDDEFCPCQLRFLTSEVDLLNSPVGTKLKGLCAHSVIGAAVGVGPSGPQAGSVFR